MVLTMTTLNKTETQIKAGGVVFNVSAVLDRFVNAGWVDGHKHNVFRVSVSVDGLTVGFNFTDSAHNYTQGVEELSDLSMLRAFGCLLSDALNYLHHDHLNAFVDAFGSGDRRVDALVFKGCKNQYGKLQNLVSWSEEEICDALNEMYTEHDM